MVMWSRLNDWESEERCIQFAGIIIFYQSTERVFNFTHVYGWRQYNNNR